MSYEDQYSRLACYAHTIMHQRSNILRLKVKLAMTKAIVKGFKEKLRDKAEHIET